MHKRIMAILFYGAFALGVAGLFVANFNQPTENKEPTTVPSPSAALDEKAAETTYKQSCVACHGNDLEGAAGPNLQKVGSRLNEQQIYKIILNGGTAGMPAFKGQLKEEEIANLSLWLAQHK